MHRARPARISGLIERRRRRTPLASALGSYLLENVKASIVQASPASRAGNARDGGKPVSRRAERGIETRRGQTQTQYRRPDRMSDRRPGTPRMVKPEARPG